MQKWDDPEGLGFNRRVPAVGRYPNSPRPAGGWLLRHRRVASALLILAGVGLIYALHFYQVRETRRQARVELEQTVQNGSPAPGGVLAAFDRSTEDVLFAAAGPYFILSVALVFLVGQLFSLKQRLGAAESELRLLQRIVLGVD